MDVLVAKLGDPPAVALRRLIATNARDNSANTQAAPRRTRSAVPDSWFEQHPVLTLLLIFVGIAGLLWLLFRRNGGPPSVPSASAPALLVSNWSPLQ